MDPIKELQKQEYVKRQWKRVENWMEDVLSGNVVACKQIKQAVQRFKRNLLRDDIEWRPSEVDKQFRYYWHININNHNVYERYEPLGYQIFIDLNIHGLYRRGTNIRLYKFGFIFTSRKSGKTTWAAIKALSGMQTQGAKQPECILLANSQLQANNALNACKQIIAHSPPLAKRLKTAQKSYDIRFREKNKYGFLRVMSSKVDNLDGFNPGPVSVIDEIHAMKDHDLFNVIKSGGLSRQNNLTILISTAGFSTNSMAYEMWEQGKRVLNQETEDDTFFYLLFSLDDGDDWKDPSNWIKSNPSIGQTLTLDDLKTEYEQAKNFPTQLNNFLTKNLNIFTNEAEQWLPEDVLKTAFDEPIDWDKFKGKECYAGIDLSSTRDLTALSLAFKDGKDIVIKTFFFFANNPSKRIRAGGIDLSYWIKEGHIIKCQTSTIDYDMLFDKIQELRMQYKIKELYYDKFNSALLIPKLERAGLTCTVFDQTARKFNEPLKYMEKLFFDEHIKMDINPVLLWNFRNLQLWIDGNGNIKPMKNRSLDSIDGCISSVQAVSGWITPDKYNISADIYS